MLIIMNATATDPQIVRVKERIEELGFTAHDIPGRTRLAIGVTGNKNADDRVYLEGLPGVLQVISVTKPYKLASRDMHPEDSVISVQDVKFGDGNVVMIAGPCAVESRDQTLRITEQVAERGAQMLRGGAYKPRTSPYSFQGLGEEALKILAEAREKTGLPIVTEVVDPNTAVLVGNYVDMLQIGTRNMQNFILLKEVGRVGKPVLLKRGMSATLDETLMSAEYLMSHGCHDVVICERGVRTFTSHARNTLDISIIPALKQVSHLPIIVDPSHSSGRRFSVIPHALAGIGAGADGLIVDVHDRPEEALCDGPQALPPVEFSELMKIAKGVCNAMGKSIGNKTNPKFQEPISKKYEIERRD
ncbi:MAG: 3-deoxy-7-phosphoheptulonate synthase [Candidatus Marinimicrobia bacterium]|nr:3-deoxy-7-phosphoheptulonate synthase [Candidatus Neomarinimicrobiota bacterium]